MWPKNLSFNFSEDENFIHQTVIVLRESLYLTETTMPTDLIWYLE